MKSFVLSLTMFRILAAPFIFMLLVFLEKYFLSFWLFNLAALTDYFDGKLAREFNVESRLGKILDPIGDKLLVLFSILAVIILTQDLFVAFMGALILSREFWVSALREYTSSVNLSNTTAVSFTSKAKTTVQFIALSMYIFGAATKLAIITFLANFVLLIAVILAFKSAIDYTKKTFAI